MTLGWIHSRAWGMLVGVTITALSAIGFAVGWFDQLWLAALDLQFRHVNFVPASPDIVMIDINDYALERVSRWPWPRRLHAELVSTLAELGASAILMDIVFSEPEAPRVEHPGLGRDYDVDPVFEVLGEPPPVFDDDELAEAMRRSGCVYAGMAAPYWRPDLSMPAFLARAEAALGDDVTLDFEAFRERMGDAPGLDLKTWYQRTRILRALREDFRLGLEDIAAWLNVSPAELDPHLADAKRLAARQAVSDYLRNHPQASFAEIREHFLPGMGADEESADREDLLRAYRTCRAVQEIESRLPATPDSLKGRIPNGWDATPVLDKLAKPARYCGFVTFEKDRGVLRRIPLLLDMEGKLLKQLGFAVVCDRLKIDDASFAMDEEGYLTFSDAEKKRNWRVPLDEEGLALMNWHIDRTSPTWEHSFTHLAVSRVMELPANRKSMERNETLLEVTLAKAVEKQLEGRGGRWADYAGWVLARNELRSKPGGGDQEELADLDAKIERQERETLQWLKFSMESLGGQQPETAEEKEIFDWHQNLVEGRLRRIVEESNERLQWRNQELVDQLRPLISGKMCFVGYTATAVADMVNTPVFENMPGVMAHANLVNTVLVNRFPRIAPRWLSILLIALSGLMVTLVTSGRGPWVSLVSVLLMLVMLIGGGVALFGLYAFEVIFIVAAISVFVCWAFITLYRQLTEERQKRKLAKALGRSTSPAIAAEIIRRPGRLDLSPRPALVTCYFSDLQGFTTISERLGPADTQAVLNRYLEQMSEVLTPNHAFTKFMGDGIFAFFNAPLLPVARHEEVACEVALRCAEALEVLKREESSGSNAEVFAGLVMRAGINAGTAYVGEYGSENQTDYTCIGDTVNLAARLEPANKLFGTRVIVSQVCREATNDRYAFRPLGKLQAKGKESAVAIYELVGRAGEVTGERRAYARQFAEGVALFQERHFLKAQKVFESCGLARPDDLAVELYLAEIAGFLESPPPQEWNQAIRMTTK